MVSSGGVSDGIAGLVHAVLLTVRRVVRQGPGFHHAVYLAAVPVPARAATRCQRDVADDVIGPTDRLLGQRHRLRADGRGRRGQGCTDGQDQRGNAEPGRGNDVVHEAHSDSYGKVWWAMDQGRTRTVRPTVCYAVLLAPFQRTDPGHKSIDAQEQVVISLPSTAPHVARVNGGHNPT